MQSRERYPDNQASFVACRPSDAANNLITSSGLFCLQEFRRRKEAWYFDLKKMVYRISDAVKRHSTLSSLFFVCVHHCRECITATSNVSYFQLQDVRFAQMAAPLPLFKQAGSKTPASCGLPQSTSSVHYRLSLLKIMHRSTADQRRTSWHERLFCGFNARMNIINSL